MFAKVNGKRVFFDVVGEGLDAATPFLRKRPVFIALHCASGFDHGYLRNGLDPLSIMGQVIYVDLPGAGRSDKAGVLEATFESLADDVAGLMDYLGIDEAFILGHCAGGFVAQHFAIKYPEKVEGLILVNTKPSFENPPNEDGSPLPSLAARAPQDVVETAYKVYGEGIITQDNVKAMLEKVGPYFFAPSQMFNYDYVFSFTSMSLPMMDRFVNHIYKTFDVRDQLSQIQARTLVIAGSKDWLTPASGARLIAERVNDATYIEFEDSCHISFAENRVGFLRVVQSFVGETEFEF